MPKFIIALFFIFSFVNNSFAYTNDSCVEYHSDLGDKKYIITLPAEITDKSSDFDIYQKQLPLSIGEAIDIAKTQLGKIVDNTKDWKDTHITIGKCNNNEKKWYYAIGFISGNFHEIKNVTILVTLDGKVGVVKEITEKIIK